MAQDPEKLIARDVVVCAGMAEELGDYLKSDVLFWEPDRRQPGGAELPKLTLGGLLLAVRRLATLRGLADADQRRALNEAEEGLALQKAEWGIRYQKKLARDLRSRLDAWEWYLDECKQQGESAIVHYSRQVETRVKIDLLLDEATELGLEVEQSRQRQIDLDQRLRVELEFEQGEFCWPDPLKAGFPWDRFWYLYGKPRAV